LKWIHDSYVTRRLFRCVSLMTHGREPSVDAARVECTAHMQSTLVPMAERGSGFSAKIDLVWRGEGTPKAA